MIGESYEEDVKIDKMALDEANVTQSEKYYFYSMQLADAKDELEAAKNYCTQREAERDLYYRQNPPDGLKPTEAVYKSLVDNDTVVNACRDKLREAAKVVATLYAAVNGMEQRKGCIDNLVRLHLAQYYSTNDNGMRDRISK